MAGFETFTIEAILSAQDKASAIIERVQGAVDKFKQTMGSAAETAAAAGEEIDASLLQTASGADALGLANDRLSASEAKLSLAIQGQAAAERELQDVYAKGLGLQEQAAAGDKLAAALRDVGKATTEAETAQRSLNDVEKALTTTNDELTVSEEAAVAGASGWVGIVLAVGAGMAAAGGLAVTAAGNFESATTHLVTDAGESSGAIKGVSQSMLSMAGDVGISADKLAQGMYHIESAGFHAAKGGLDVLLASAEGTKVGNADLDTVSKTLAGTMVSYGAQANKAASFMNMLIETTAQGDLRMQDLASTLGNVTPIAAAAGISFDQVGGAIATMTAQNMPAAQATQNLAHFIQSLQKPTDVTRKSMQGLGLDSYDVSSNLGTRGLTGTLAVLTKAIDDHNHLGGVFINTLQGSQHAAEEANRMLGIMAPTVRNLSQELLDGKIGVKEYNKAVAELDPVSVKQGHQFLTLQENMGAFNKLIASGSPEAETYAAALSSVTGGQIGLRTALMLSVDGGQKFSEAAQEIAKVGAETGNKVKNWDTIQTTFNQRLDEAKAKFDSLGIVIGEKILPYVEKILGVMAVALDWFSKNKLAVEALAVALGVTLGAALIVIGVLVAGVIAVLTAIGLIFMGIAKAAVYIWGALKTAWKGIVEASESLWDKMTSVFNSIVDSVLSAWHWIEKVTTSVWDGITGFFKKWWPLLYAVFATPIFLLQALWVRFHDAIMSVVSPAWEWIKKTMSTAWSWLVGAAKLAWHLIRDWIVDPIEEVAAWIGGAMNWVTKQVSGAFDGLLHWLSGVGDWFSDVGAHIVDGIWSGVTSKWDWLMNKVSGLANGMLQAAKDAIKVGSPSRRFADEVGKWIPHGIAAGVEEHAGVARNAVRNMADSLVGDYGFAGGLGGGGGAGGGGSAVIIDMRGSQVMSDRDMDLFVDKIGRQIATRLLPAGGVRIRS